MKRVFHKARDFKEAEEWDIFQQVKMTPEERQKVATQLREKVYGKNAPDVRDNQAKK
jgi:predicted Fe-S protein YdhL (DUF1289 family)